MWTLNDIMPANERKKLASKHAGMETCSDCGCKRKWYNLFCNEDNEQFCLDCINERLVKCDDCGKEHPFMLGTEDGYYYCKNCVDYLSEDVPRTRREYLSNKKHIIL